VKENAKVVSVLPSF